MLVDDVIQLGSGGDASIAHLPAPPPTAGGVIPDLRELWFNERDTSFTMPGTLTSTPSFTHSFIRFFDTRDKSNTRQTLSRVLGLWSMPAVRKEDTQPSPGYSFSHSNSQLLGTYCVPGSFGGRRDSRNILVNKTEGDL